MRASVGAKLGMAFIVALLILILVGAFCYVGLEDSAANAEWVTHTYQVRENLRSLLQAMTDAETGQRGYLITGKDAYLEPYTDGSASVSKYADAVSKLISDNPVEQENLSKLRDLCQARLADLQQVMDAARAKGPDGAAQSLLASHGKAQMDAIRDMVDHMQDIEGQLLTQRSKAAAASIFRAKLIIVLGTIGAAIVLSILGLLLTRNIARPLREITQAAERIAGGDLGGTVANNHRQDERQDEVGMLARTFAHMSVSLRGTAEVAKHIADGDLKVQVRPQSERDMLGHSFAAMVRNLQTLLAQASEGINVLGTSASQISTSTTQLAASAAQTATAVSEATTTVEEVRQTAQLASQKSKAVSTSAQRMAQISQVGSKATDEVISGIGRIRQQMDSIADCMVRLSEQTQTISNIVTTVEDLAAQSSILAVNASIEAARAGEHGKGFVVVAQEVRNLAEQSKQATGQVRSILADVQKATNAAVMAAEQGSKAVDAGVQQANDAGTSIQTLAANVSESADTATQIAASSQQQLVGVDQVATAMESIKQASAQNVASARQLEAAAHSLKDMGSRLQQILGTYQV